MGIASGALNRRISIQIATVTKDDSNDDVKTWDHAYHLWAAKSDVQGWQTLGPQELVRQGDTIWEIRQSERSMTIAPESHRIEFKGVLYQIVSIFEGKERNDTRKLLTSSRPDLQGARGRGAISGE